MNWTCPECSRDFGRANQSHMCAPGLTLDEFFASGHDRERPIFDVVHGHLADLGPVIVDPVQVGILFKNGPVFAELRPKKKWVALTFMLPIRLDHPRMSRKVIPVGGKGSRFYHVVNVERPEDVDGQVLDWLTEAYLTAEL